MAEKMQSTSVDKKMPTAPHKKDNVPVIKKSPDQLNAGDLSKLHSVLENVEKADYKGIHEGIPVTFMKAPDGSGKLTLIDKNGHLRHVDAEIISLDGKKYVEFLEVETRSEPDADRGRFEYDVEFKVQISLNGEILGDSPLDIQSLTNKLKKGIIETRNVRERQRTEEEKRMQVERELERKHIVDEKKQRTEKTHPESVMGKQSTKTSESIRASLPKKIEESKPKVIMNSLGKIPGNEKAEKSPTFNETDASKLRSHFNHPSKQLTILSDGGFSFGRDVVKFPKGTEKVSIASVSTNGVIKTAEILLEGSNGEKGSMKIKSVDFSSFSGGRTEDNFVSVVTKEFQGRTEEKIFSEKRKNVNEKISDADIRGLVAAFQKMGIFVSKDGFSFPGSPFFPFGDTAFFEIQNGQYGQPGNNGMSVVGSYRADVNIRTISKDGRVGRISISGIQQDPRFPARIMVETPTMRWSR